MRILLDLQGAQTQSRFRGIGRYSLALAKAICRNRGEHEIFVCLNSALSDSVSEVKRELADCLPTTNILTFESASPTSFDSPENRWRREASECCREAFIAEFAPDVIHVSSLFEGGEESSATSIGKVFDHIPTAVTFYDLIPLLNPERYLGNSWPRGWYFEKIEHLKRADLLLAISDYARTEALDHLGIDSERVRSISTACDPIFFPAIVPKERSAELMYRYGIKNKYLMYQGALESRKNLDALLQAFSRLSTELIQKYQLVFVGHVSDSDRLRLLSAANSLGISERFILTGYVPDADLVDLFRLCELFVFPSLHEGFGLPVLEAMACGAAVIGSSVTSIPEVIGRADALFDPKSPQSICALMTHALTDTNYLRSLREHALVQADKFSWDATGKRAIEGFEYLGRKFDIENIDDAFSWQSFVRRQAAAENRLIDSIAKITGSHEATERDLCQISEAIACNQRAANSVARTSALPDRINWRIEGPFDSSYSLALLNRETARALDELGHIVSLHSTEGPGDFDPDAKFLAKNPNFQALHSRGKATSAIDVDVTSRNLYPPRVDDMQSRLNLLHHYAWEESGFPRKWAEDFNEYLQGITCLSHHVRKILLDAGVTAPLSVSGCGVDHWDRVEPDAKYKINRKSFRFLHVSSCFPRKGADVLVKAYGSAFSSKDDVSLIIKTFENPHNDIHKWIADCSAGRSDFPDIQVIETDLSDAQLKSIYEACDVLVAPSRAEGFGLPIAEAMLSGLDVITTGWGGQLDFCNAETAQLINYRFARSDSHLGLFESVWAEPDVDHLAHLMREVHRLPTQEKGRRAAKGAELLRREFKWVDVAKRMVDSARQWSTCKLADAPKIGWVSTWNVKCGIATYSEHLLDNFPGEVTVFGATADQVTRPDKANVVRCWTAGTEDSLETMSAEMERSDIGVLVVQFNYGFFNFESFSRFIESQLDHGRIILITLHSTIDPPSTPDKRICKLVPSLRRCHRILVHTPADLNRLVGLGLIENVSLFPHGVLDYLPAPTPPSADGRFRVASFGFFLPHKGLLELIEAIDILIKRGFDVELIMVNAEYPVPESRTLLEKARLLINIMGLDDRVRIISDFLEDSASLEWLSSADLVVFPYQDTGESASGAVRYGLASGTPVAVTPIPIFEDIADVVFNLPGPTVEQIASGIYQLAMELKSSSEPIAQKRVLIDLWREEHRYPYLARKLSSIMQGIYMNFVR